jgi:acetylornithine/N-succinyldiaminopimelate aminotransferase
MTTPVSATRTPLLETYARIDVTFVSGDGAWLVDADGRRYLDLVGGIAVVGLGHRHPAPLAAAHAQLDRLWHVSNLYWTEPMSRLAERLSERFGGAQSFFCNSGAEAIEAALKYARKSTGKRRIVALENSFHGRTLGALSVTGQPSKRAAFEPLVPEVAFARLNDSASLAAAVDDDTACVLIEPVQGEGGIHPARPEFLARARTLADERGALLVFDEVQTGVGRTGEFFAWQHADVKPDAVTLAKGLANGLPIGALLVADETAGAFEPGDHASTFGGNPVACAAACAVVETVDDALLADVRRKGERLARAAERLPCAVEVRGAGLLLGLEIDRVARDAISACLERGVLVGSAGERVLRLTPPLTIADDELDHALAVLQEVLS